MALVLTTWFGRLSGSGSQQQAEAGQDADELHDAPPGPGS